jgi:hypothetical protein
MPDGTTRRREVSGKSEAIVRKKLTELQARSDQGIPAEATGWTVEKFLAYWLEHIARPALKPRTIQGYEVVVRVHLVPALGRKRLSKLTAVDVRTFLRALESRCLCCLHAPTRSVSRTSGDAARSAAAASPGRRGGSCSRCTPSCATRWPPPSGKS